MHPNISINYSAVFISTLAGFVFGFLWYGPLMGKAWAKEMGMDLSKRPETKMMVRSMVFQFLGLFLTAFVLAHSNQVWRPSVWGTGPDQADAVYGYYGGFFTWLGFYLPMQLGKVAWEGRSYKLFGINLVHDFVTLQIISQILAHWHF